MRTNVGAAKAIHVDDRHRRLARHRMIALPNKEIGNPPLTGARISVRVLSQTIRSA
jgi:hypothetical protein